MDVFVRFLEIAGQFNAHPLNFENLSGDTGKSGNTIQSWYQILEDTLLGARVTIFVTVVSDFADLLIPSSRLPRLRAFLAGRGYSSP